jgi:hypothetical protein
MGGKKGEEEEGEQGRRKGGGEVFSFWAFAATGSSFAGLFFSLS